jgi:hypothetical protein
MDGAVVLALIDWTSRRAASHSNFSLMEVYLLQQNCTGGWRATRVHLTIVFFFVFQA